MLNVSTKSLARVVTASLIAGAAPQITFAASPPDPYADAVDVDSSFLVVNPQNALGAPD
jgi:hypothetical protein